MDRGALLRRKADIEQRFEEVSKTRTDADDEMKRLQGEHRLVLDLLDSAPLDKSKKLGKAEDNATDSK